MLLGKRPRPPIRRTTSMTGITVDLSHVEAQEPRDTIANLHNACTVGGEGPNGFDQSFLCVVSPRNQRRSSADFMDTSHFLATCGLCKRPLPPARDIYMYRGDTAFCSLECREQQMKKDERKEKCRIMASKKQDHHPNEPDLKLPLKAKPSVLLTEIMET